MKTQRMLVLLMGIWLFFVLASRTGRLPLLMILCRKLSSLVLLLFVLCLGFCCIAGILLHLANLVPIPMGLAAVGYLCWCLWRIGRDRIRARRCRAIHCWQFKLACEGNADAQLWMGLEGDDACNPAQAHWLERSARHGHPWAQMHFAIALERGIEGVENGKEQAFTWFLRSANQNVAYSQRQAGDKLARGTVVFRDYVEAIKWLLLAERQGDVEAGRIRLQIQGLMQAKDVEEGFRRAAAFRPASESQEEVSEGELITVPVLEENPRHPFTAGIFDQPKPTLGEMKRQFHNLVREKRVNIGTLANESSQLEAEAWKIPVRALSGIPSRSRRAFSPSANYWNE